MKKYFKVVENSNTETTYGLLIVEREDISEKEVINCYIKVIRSFKKGSIYR